MHERKQSKRASQRTEESVTMMTRRGALGAFASVAASAAVWPDTAAASDANSRRRTSAIGIIAAGDHSVVNTASGSVRGYERNGIFTFKGIPYGEPTSGANRFKPPVKVQPWTGVRSSLQYGPVCPQPTRTGWKNDEEAFMFRWDDGQPAEDCLRVNVWTPSLGANAKRPVMVWLHGGGFVAGSGQELLAYDGENLARRGDIVVVSLNHRLGPFGHLDLSGIGGEPFAASGNVGMLDIVLALEWVRDNIGEFGGDPRSVTIFGQSGGGGKVNTLMAMPAAQGLFHRAIVQSGSILRARSTETSTKLAQEILRELDLDAKKIAELQYMPYAQLVAAGVKVLSRQPRSMPDFRRMADALGWGPVRDGKVLPEHPFDPEAPAISADVPLLVGTTLNEFTQNINNPVGEALSEPELLTRVTGIYGERAKQVIAVFRERTPNAKPFDIWSRVASAPIRGAAIEQCTRKEAQRAAPAWLYWFTWQTPILDGRPRAFHCAELPFVFNNAERCESMTGGGAEAVELAHRMSDAWIRFARSGNPNGAGLPNWPAFRSDRPATMMFDARPTVLTAPDANEQSVIARSA